MEMDRKKEVINICLDHFIENGLYETSTRSLSKALKLQSAGLYYYFTSKDEAVIQCATEAAIRIENALILPAIHDLDDPDYMMKRLQSRADEMAPAMRFLVTVSSSKRYREEIRPVIDGMGRRYLYYTEIASKKLNCDKEEIEPYMFMTISAVVNYMIFGETSLAIPQLEIVKDKIASLQAKEG